MNRLELTWVGKENRPRLEPRILRENKAKSYHATAKVSENDLFDNRLIHGDNLLALKALEHEFAGKVQCVFIDPPYNTGSAFEHYEDGVEHSLWLSLIRDRLEMLRRLLSDDGSLWITIDDNEAHYLKVLCDEVFGRRNFVANVVWEKADSPRMDAEFFSVWHDHVLVYAKNRDSFKLNKPRQMASEAGHYTKTDAAGRPYFLNPLRKMGGDDARADRPTMFFPIEAPDGTQVFPKRKDGSDGRWRWGPEKVAENKHLIDWTKGKNGWNAYYRIFGDNETERPPDTIWRNDIAGTNRNSKAEIKALFGDVESFDTPKPEKLMKIIIELATKPGDIVLDSFAGSGTTGAVAHKLRRRWLMVEMGDHCSTHIAPRLRKVIDNKDPGGITPDCGWTGGGGFRYLELAPSLLERDEFGNWVVSKEYNASMLAEAVCKLEGYKYEPSDSVYWQQGKTSGESYIYVTTQTLTVDQLRTLNNQVGLSRSLLVCCGSFTAKNLAEFPRLVVKKIPKTVLHRCEWGHDDYSLEIKNLPVKAPEPTVTDKPATTKDERRKSVSLLNYSEG